MELTSEEKQKIYEEEKARFEAQGTLKNVVEQGKKLKEIKETKCTCSACGNVWFYGKEEVMAGTANSLANCGKTMMCCSGCAPALLVKDKDVKNLNKCPKCGSKAVNKEVVVHNISA